ncbi:MAG: hypothetical protein AAFO94_17085, partial [Bacteroidota bacterium]
IGWRTLEQYPNLANVCTLHGLADLKLTKHFDFLLKKAQQQLQRSEVPQFHFMLEAQLMADIASQELEARQKRGYNVQLQRASDQLDQYYFFHKLKYSCSMLAWQSFISVEYETPFLEEITSYLRTQPNNVPTVDIYLKIYQLLSADQPEVAFEKLMQLLDDSVGALPIKEQKEVYLHAFNFCAKKLRRGENEYLEKAFHIYRKGIEKRILFDGPHLSSWTYSNVVKLGLRLKEYDWTRAFIFQYKDFIDPNFRENTFAYNVSELYYYTKDYDGAMDYLTKVKFEDIYHLNTRVILIKIYYETDEATSLHSLIASFSMFLKRNKKMAGNIKQTYLNFCRLLNRILRRNRKEAERLRQEIEELPLLTERTWLIDVLEKEFRR